MLFISKKKIIIIVFILLVVLTIFLLIKYNKKWTIVTSTVPVENRIIILDAGHRSDQTMEPQVMKE